MGLFAKHYAFIFVKITVGTNGNIKYQIDSFCSAKHHLIKKDGKMDIDLLTGVWNEGVKANPKIAASADEWIMFGEVKDDNVIISDLVQRVVSETNIGWKRADPKEITKKGQFGFRMSDLKRINPNSTVI